MTFAYPSDVDGQAFELGPLDLTFERGEIVFLVGGNGSGKSTFVKVLTGLYEVRAGAIHLDGAAITPDNREWYCQHFSAVFSDFYLFDTLLGLDRAGLDARAHRLLVELELDAKLRIVDGALSTTALSQGQRKRLALLTAFLEDRPIYVFDEWAADQDPHYREIFYKRLLPELKANGKTVFVISHDDRYYHLGDRVVKLEYGKVMEDRRSTLAKYGFERRRASRIMFHEAGAGVASTRSAADRYILVRMTPPDAHPARQRRHPLREGGRFMQTVPSDPAYERRLSRLLLDVLIRAGLILVLAMLCYRIFAPFLVLMVWALILAVTLYPLHQALAARMGGRQGWAATLITLLGVALIVAPTARAAEFDGRLGASLDPRSAAGHAADSAAEAGRRRMAGGRAEDPRLLATGARQPACAGQEPAAEDR